MKPNETIRCIGKSNKASKNFVVTGEVCHPVWALKDVGGEGEYLLNLIDESRHEKWARKIDSVESMYDIGETFKGKAEGVELALPLHLYENDGEFGYVTKKYSGKVLSDMMLSGDFDRMPLETRLEIAQSILKSVEFFRENGLSHRDVSLKNFAYDEAEKKLTVIGCENMTPNAVLEAADCCFSGESGFYASPEVVFKLDLPSRESDMYTLACVLYKIMTGSSESPYHGKVMYLKFNGFMPNDMFDAACLSKEDKLGRDWLTFVFDPDNTVNEILPTMFKNEDFRLRKVTVIENWEKTPTEIKELFQRAFFNPLGARARKNRPSVAEWKDAIEKQLCALRSVRKEGIVR